MKNLFINYANPSDKVLSIKSLLFLLIFILPTIVFGQTTLCSTYGGNTPDHGQDFHFQARVFQVLIQAK